MVCQFGRGWHTNFGVLCTPNFLECSVREMSTRLHSPSVPVMGAYKKQLAS